MPHTNSPSPAPVRSRAAVWIVTSVAALAGFLYGYDTGIISGALLKITAEFEIDHRVQEMITASILVGAVVGALLSGRVSEAIGRRKTIMIVSLIFLAGALVSAISPTPETLMLSRVFLGLAVGGASQAAPVYIAEIAPAVSRGAMVATFNFATALGILAANVVSFWLTAWSWQQMVAIAAIPAIVLFIAMFFMPESPRWLASRGRRPQARAVLSRLRRPAQVDPELADIDRILEREKTEQRGWRVLGAPWVRPAVIASLGFAAFTQLSGIEMMIYYTPTFMTTAGLSVDFALLSSLLVAVMFATTNFIGRWLVDKVGRRGIVLLLVPGAALSLFSLGTAFAVGSHNPVWILLSLLGFIVFVGLSVQCCGWLLGSELYPLSARGPGSSANAAVVWGANLLATGTALTLVNLLGVGGAIIVYGGINVVGWVFVWKFVPETKGVSLEEVEQALRAGEFTPRGMEARHQRELDGGTASATEFRDAEEPARRR